MRFPLGVLAALVMGALVDPASAGVERAVGPDSIPLFDWDAHEAAPAKSSLRARWMLRPDDAATALSRLAETGVERVAVLERFGGRWILEAPAESAPLVEERFGSLGTLVRDRSGTPALLESTALVGARDAVWGELDLQGDITSTVAILDSGCDTAHDDLGDPDLDDQDSPPQGGDDDDWVDAAVSGHSSDPRVRVVGWHDVSDDLPEAAGPYDYHYHGTAVTSAGFGAGRITPDQRGVAPGGRVVVVKTWNFESRWELWASDLLLGIDWVLDHRDVYRIRAVLIAASWDEDLGISEGVQALVDAGIVVVASAGNDAGGAMGWPARVDDVVAVGATNSLGMVASYSTRGGPETDRLDLVAPGGSLVDVDDTIVVADNEPNDAYRGRVGTSLAAAHVAGAVSLVAEAHIERGGIWEPTRRQARWAHDLLRVTAVETAGAEAGGPGIPRLDRVGGDPVEGHGLLQIRSAVDAVRNVVWPGESATFTLEAPTDGRATYAARIPLAGALPFQADLVPPASADFDLLLYHEREDGLQLVASALNPTAGASESLRLDRPRPGTYVLVVRRVLGSGEATLLTDRVVDGATAWPLALSAQQRSVPAVYDLDGDGDREIILVNNLAIDATAHRFHAVRKDGQNHPLFPRTYFSSSELTGELTAPAVGVVGDGVRIVSGAEFGQVFAVRADAQLAWVSLVTPSLPTTAPSIWNEGPLARVLVGSFDGIAKIDPDGQLEATLPIAAGVSADLAVGDVDGDGVEEIAAVDRLGMLHLLEIDGSELPGWPVALGTPGSRILPPVLVGDFDGGGARRVAIAWHDAAGEARLHVFGVDASTIPGFPVALLPPSGGNTLTASPVTPSVLRRGGETHLVVTTVARDATGSARLQLVRVARDGTALPTQERRLYERALPSAIVGGGTVKLDAPVVGAVSSYGDLEVLAHVQLSWFESTGAAPLRYGSLDQVFTFDDGGVDRTFELPFDGGHRNFFFPRGPGPTLVDLDDDGGTELLLARDARLYLESPTLPAHVDEAWGTERGDAARRACYGCEERVVVSAPEPRLATLGLQAAPNPFNPRTELRLRVPNAGTVHWSVFDARGRRVREWSRTLSSAGEWREIFEPSDGRGAALASGSYLVRARFGEETATVRLTLVR